MASLRNVLRAVRELSGPFSWSTASYAQEGEDLVLNRIFAGKRGGFYVEVGCHHPFRFSNTYLFYRRGWRGLCIDPLPGTVSRFKRWRPRDITLERGVALQESTLTYYLFNEPALNTFDPTVADRHAHGGYRVIGNRPIPTEPLARLIEANLPASVQHIDFFSIDVEGLDLDVLRSNDWQRYAPKAVVAECIGTDLADLRTNAVAMFMREKGYEAYAKTGYSVVFLRN